MSFNMNSRPFVTYVCVFFVIFCIKAFNLLVFYLLEVNCKSKKMGFVFSLEHCAMSVMYLTSYVIFEQNPIFSGSEMVKSI